MDGTYWLLNMRIERPVSGLVLTPTVYLSVKGNTMDNATKVKLVESTPHVYRYRWYRSAAQQLCINPSCPKGSRFAPDDWTSFNCEGWPVMVCVYCEKMKYTGKRNFCSRGCFHACWRDHAKEFHTRQISHASQDRSMSVVSEEDRVVPESTSIVEEWSLVSDRERYVPSNADVGHSLRVECSVFTQITSPEGYEHHEILVGPAFAYTETVLAYPQIAEPRKFKKSLGAANKPDDSGLLRVVTYNVLAEIYATKMAFKYCDNWTLSWSYRKALLMQELLQVKADVICLQEVQSDSYELDIYPELRAIGYDGVYLQKNRESMGPIGKVDGCAIFWITSKLNILECFHVDFNEEARAEAAQMKTSEINTRRFLTKVCKDNVAIFVEFELTTPGLTRRICVANTHIYSGNNRTPEVKLLQTWMLTTKLQQFVAMRRHQGIEVPVILCGDFNSLVDSAVYNFLRDGHIADLHPDFEGVDLSLLPDVKRITHSLDLLSAMTINGCEEPEFTNYTHNFRGTLDYIWCSATFCQVEGYLELPSEEDILNHGQALPNALRPSDHLMLGIDFNLRSSQSTEKSFDRSSSHAEYKQNGNNIAPSMLLKR